MEGYYFGTTCDQWAPLAEARASHFHEPARVATVVPCHVLRPDGAATKVEVLGLRDHWNGFDKYIPREDRWPKRVWDWPIPLPYRQGIRLRDTIWTGGQVPYEPDANSGRAVFAGDLMPQTRFTMSYVEDILRGFGAHHGRPARCWSATSPPTAARSPSRRSPSSSPPAAAERCRRSRSCRSRACTTRR